jgi:hypothetical protein
MWIKYSFCIMWSYKWYSMWEQVYISMWRMKQIMWNGVNRRIDTIVCENDKYICSMLKVLEKRNGKIVCEDIISYVVCE